MGSTLISEVLNDIPHWSNMIDTRSHRTEQTSYNISNSFRNNTSQSHRRSISQTSQNTSIRQPLQSSESTPKKDVSSNTNLKQTSNQQSKVQEITFSPSKNSKITSNSQNHQHMSSNSPPLPHNQSIPIETSPSSIASHEPTNDSPTSPIRIKVRDLQHIQSFAIEGNSSITSSPDSDQVYSTSSPQYEISEMPIGDIIEMVAGLLTKITATNDQHYEHLHRQIPSPEATSNMSSQTSSVLAFHGKNVPSITILSYLSRIHKYCPATWEVFLSLLVYFDRMTERVNSGPIQSLRQADQEFMKNSSKESSNDQNKNKQSSSKSDNDSNEIQSESSNMDTNLSHFFVVDSFNIHRLVIAGVTCAAKYFSDIFFTNSRYAKVGGLPLMELNNLELQFLVLNDFRLAVPVEELEAYATMLVEFYAREIVAQRQNEKSEGIEMVTR